MKIFEDDTLRKKKEKKNKIENKTSASMQAGEEFCFPFSMCIPEALMRPYSALILLFDVQSTLVN